jgi:argininosuccinate synthase
MTNTSKDVVVAYSGGPDAAALFLKLREVGCNHIHVYISYRANVGGKTAEDIRYAQQALGITGDTLEILHAPLEGVSHS